MMKYGYLIILLFCCVITNAQSLEEIFIVVEVQPRFPGCEAIDGTHREKETCAKEKLSDFIYSNLVYPSEAKEKGIEGKSVVQFLIDSLGQITEPKIIKSLGGGIDEEALRIVDLIKSMDKKWSPGLVKGKAVKVLYTLPIEFTLDKKTKRQLYLKYKDAPVLSQEEVDEEPFLTTCGETLTEKVRTCSDQKIQEFIFDNLIYPDKSFKKKHEDNVKVSFVVTRFNEMKDIQVSGKYKALNKEAKELIDKLTKEYSWSAAKKDRTPVHSRIELEVVFDLDDGWD